jgi:excisionase family DNA binding protein
MKHLENAKKHSKIEAISVAEVAARLGLSRVSAYRAVRRGDLPSIRIGGLIRIPLAPLERLLEGTTPPGEARDDD